MIIVHEGSLALTLPYIGSHKVFEFLRSGSSLGQYSLLKRNVKGEGELSFLVKSERNSHIFLVSYELLQKVRSKYQNLDKAVRNTVKWLAINGQVPLCDFFIDHDRVSDLAKVAKTLHKEKIAR